MFGLVSVRMDLVSTAFSADNDPDQRGPGAEYPFVKTDHRSSVASDGYVLLGYLYR